MKVLIILFLLFLSVQFIHAGEPLIIDHNASARFESIPQDFIEKAISLRMMFRHASVGWAIESGLECLQGTKSKCKDYPKYKYDRRAWKFIPRGNSGWYGKIDDFIAAVEDSAGYFDVMSFKYCYLDGLDETDMPCGKYPSNPEKVKKAWDYLRDNILYLENKYPEKRFVWWTIPLTQSGQHCTDELNNMIRSFCMENGKILFDLADIECHDTLGNLVLGIDNTEKAFKPYCGEPKPDAVACHPGDLGALVISKAIWVMMARIAGWDPVSDVVESENNKLIYYPTPCTDYLVIESQSRKTDDEVVIYSILGEKSTSHKITSSGKLRLCTSSLNTGMYIIRLGAQTSIFYKI